MEFPKKSHRKPISLPRESSDLAELLGIILGDGGVNNDWQLVISLNSIADREYSEYVRSLLERLFNLDVSVRKRPNQNTLVLVCSSMNLLDFLFSKGVVKGNKIKQKIDIPGWINSDTRFKKAFVRGLMDTDGCLYVHRHYVQGRLYSNLGLCFTSFSPKLVVSVANILQEQGIKSYISQNGTRLYVYRQASVLEYLDIFRTSNPRITRKSIEWKQIGLSYKDGEVA